MVVVGSASRLKRLSVWSRKSDPDESLAVVARLWSNDAICTSTAFAFDLGLQLHPMSKHRAFAMLSVTTLFLRPTRDQRGHCILFLATAHLSCILQLAVFYCYPFTRTSIRQVDFWGIKT
jgi:hypothetical protein